MKKIIFWLFIICVSLFIFTRHAADSQCSDLMLRTAKSPNGESALTQTQRICTTDEAYSPTKFSLDGDVIFEGKASKKFYANTVLAKWIDDENILIAKPKGYDYKIAKSQVNGINIHLADYLNDPDKMSEPKILKEFIKPKLSFETNNGYGAPGLGCDLWIKASDGAYLKDLAVRLSLSKAFSAKASEYDAPNRTWHNVVVPEKLVGSVLIFSSQEVKKKVEFTTGAKLDGLSFNQNLSWHREDKHGHAWQMHYQVYPEEVLEAVRQLQKGALKIKTGFWLDGIKIIYEVMPTSEADEDALVSFKHCLMKQH